MMGNEAKIRAMAFADVYPLYVQKATRKGRSQAEVDAIVLWLTAYEEKSLRDQIDRNANFEEFFNQAPAINPNAAKVTGLICGYRVEEIQDPIVRLVRCLDKMIDELAKGKSMEKILRV